MAYRIIGEPQKAIEDYNKAIELNPKYLDAYSNRGVAYNYLNNIEKMCSNYKKRCELGNCDKYKLAQQEGLCN